VIFEAQFRISVVSVLEESEQPARSIARTSAAVISATPGTVLRARGVNPSGHECIGARAVTFPVTRRRENVFNQE
jgi:hypothetical protein